jgi:hypothetical protein
LIEAAKVHCTDELVINEKNWRHSTDCAIHHG